MKFSFQTLALELLTLVLLMGSSSVMASHSYGGLDLCALYPEVMPPGLMPDQLPDAGGPGAVLMQGYCTQCHALPGPGRHSAEEWPHVLDRMLVLMDVADRFGGLLGDVKTPASDERDQLRNYLELHALKPMAGAPQGLGASAFESHCSACHILPDPGQHSLEEWPAVLKRMQHNMSVMKYAPPSRELMVQIQYFLQQDLQAGFDPAPAGTAPALSGTTGDSGFNARNVFDSGRWMALGPFLLLVFVGLARWWQGRVRP
jgi:mono/diheme cytochrome c family protein